MEKELDFLDKIWGLVREWQDNYSSWKDGSFVDIKVRRAPRVGARVGVTPKPHLPPTTP